jgi:hypothetical protein
MSLLTGLRHAPAPLSVGSKYTTMNGIVYLAVGLLFVVWPGAVQTLFMDRAFVGDEAGLFRVLGLTVVVIGWLYYFGGHSGSRQVVAASVIDRLIFVPWCCCLWPLPASSPTSWWHSPCSTCP